MPERERERERESERQTDRQEGRGRGSGSGLYAYQQEPNEKDSHVRTPRQLRTLPALIVRPPLSSKYGTYQTAVARFYPWLSGKADVPKDETAV